MHLLLFLSPDWLTFCHMIISLIKIHSFFLYLFYVSLTKVLHAHMFAVLDNDYWHDYFSYKNLLSRKAYMLAVLDKFLPGFYVSNKVNFQNYFANKLIRCFVFEVVQNKLASRVLSGIKHSAIAWHVLNPIKHCCSCFKHYFKLSN